MSIFRKICKKTLIFISNFPLSDTVTNDQINGLKGFLIKDIIIVTDPYTPVYDYTSGRQLFKGVFARHQITFRGPHKRLQLS